MHHLITIYTYEPGSYILLAINVCDSRHNFCSTTTRKTSDLSGESAMLLSKIFVRKQTRQCHAWKVLYARIFGPVPTRYLHFSIQTNPEDGCQDVILCA